METDDEQGSRRDAAKAWDDNEQSRRRQLREDAGRSPAEGLALSEFLSTFTGAARDDLELWKRLVRVESRNPARQPIETS
jgi:hypothetical protein